MQEEVGLRTATDGEFRRSSWHMDFIYQLGGVRKVQDHLSVKFHSDEGDIEFTPVGRAGGGADLAAGADLRRRVPLPGRHRVARRQTPKLTIPSPSMVHYRGGRAAIDEDVYPDLDQFWSDLTDAYADQVRAIGELGCTLPAVRRHEPRVPQRPRAARARALDRRRRRAPARDLHPPHQRGARAPARRHGRHHPHVQGQLPLVVGRRGRLRLRGGGAVRRARRRRLLHGVGRRALGRLRAAALRPGGQGRRARPRHDQARRAGVQGPAQAPDRGGDAVRGPRPALPVAAVRLLLHRGGQQPHAEQQAAKLRLVVEMAEEVWG